jgi:hypothetical protein
LQNAIKEYVLDKFCFLIFELYDNSNDILLVNIETKYFSYFNPEYLYYFKYIATSLLGYKHTLETKLKMINRFK